MDDWSLTLPEYILNHFGRTGSLIFLLAFVAILVTGYILLNRLPESKEDDDRKNTRNNKKSPPDV